MKTNAEKSNPKVEAYLAKAKKWRGEMSKLRIIIRQFPLTEELKWGKPAYSFQKSNVVIIIALKESCALMFCKGALLKDTKGLLGKPGENTQAGRWLKFASVREIAKLTPVLKSYLQEAIEVEKSGREVIYKKTSDFKIPDELQRKLDVTPGLQAAFAKLTPGRQRGYLLYFSAPKQSKTRESRVEKYIPQIRKGKGLHD